MKATRRMADSSRLLIDEEPLLVLPSLAEAIGLYEAIIVQQIHFWTHLNKKRESSMPEDKRQHFREGRWWTYNTYSNWQKHNFRFWSAETVKRVLRSAEAKGIVISKQFEKSGWDHTKWYALDYERLNAITDGVILPHRMGEFDPIEEGILSPIEESKFTPSSNESETNTENTSKTNNNGKGVVVVGGPDESLPNPDRDEVSWPVAELLALGQSRKNSERAVEKAQGRGMELEEISGAIERGKLYAASEAGKTIRDTGAWLVGCFLDGRAIPEPEVGRGARAISPEHNADPAMCDGWLKTLRNIEQERESAEHGE